MPIRVVECLDWNVSNHPGVLLKYADHFKADKVNLDAFWAYVSHTGQPKLAAIAKKPARLRAALKKLGVPSNASRCFYLTGRDKAGVLVDALTALAEARVNVECVDAMAADGHFSAAFCVGEADLARAKRLLKVK